MHGRQAAGRGDPQPGDRDVTVRGQQRRGGGAAARAGAAGGSAVAGAGHGVLAVAASWPAPVWPVLGWLPGIRMLSAPR